MALRVRWNLLAAPDEIMSMKDCIDTMYKPSHLAYYSKNLVLMI